MSESLTVRSLELLSSEAVTAQEERAFRAYVGDTRSYAAQAAANLAAIEGVRGKAAYARAILLPERSYVEQRDAGYGRRLRRAVTVFRRWRRG